MMGKRKREIMNLKKKDEDGSRNVETLGDKEREKREKGEEREMEIEEEG
jgi:hypothetical protein